MLVWSKIKRVIFANGGVAFTLAALVCGASVELLDAVIKSANFFFARELRACGWRPGALVPTGKNEMGPFLILRLRNRQQLNTCVNMISCRHRAAPKVAAVSPSQRKNKARDNSDGERCDHSRPKLAISIFCCLQSN